MVVLFDKTEGDPAPARERFEDIEEGESVIYKEVVIIGNGPSGIALSYFLSGNCPYYNGKGEHHYEMLHYRLMSSSYNNNTSIIEQDLKFLSQDLEGRSANPIALLFDALNHPQADLGQENPSLLDWEFRPERTVNHVVIGKGAPGGAWTSMEGSVLTISLGCWMELPGMNFRTWNATQESQRHLRDTRVSVMAVAQYYKDYVQQNKLQKYFVSNSVITSVTRLQHTPSQKEEDEEMTSLPKSRNCDNNIFNEEDAIGSTITHNGRRHTISEMPLTSARTSRYNCQRFPGRSNANKLWKVKGFTLGGSDDPGSITPFTYITPNVVLATGSSDKSNILNVSGENLPFVLHSLRDLENLILSGHLNPDSDPILVVGAGLSAADAIIAARFHSLSVIHIFRRSVDDPNLIFRQLPENMYPEYHKVYSMMRDPSGYERYKALEGYRIAEIMPDHKVRIVGPNICGILKVSNCIVCIGSHPDLSFMGDELQYNLGVRPDTPIDCKSNPINIDPTSHQVKKYPGLFALGPLVSENFVRFLQGGALAITSHLFKNRENNRMIDSAYK